MKADELKQKVTDQLIAEIEAGAGTWTMPWSKLGGVPRNVTTGKAYRGINFWLLGAAANEAGYDSHQWGTYKAWKAKGHQVQSVAEVGHGTRIIYVDYSRTKRDKETGEIVKAPFAKAYVVHAREQTDAPPLERVVLTEHERHEQAERYFAAVGAKVRYGGDRAYYDPDLDYVAVPLIGQFPHRDHFYSTLAHEHVHWTAAKPRLARDLSGRFGDEAYAAEELIAEIGAAFLGAQLGLNPAIRTDHAAYLDNWLKILRADKGAIVTAASKASDAVDYLNSLAQPAEVEQEDKELIPA